MTAQNHESLKTLISGLSITHYQALHMTELDESERRGIRKLLREEEISLSCPGRKRTGAIRPETNISSVGLGYPKPELTSARLATFLSPIR